MPTYLYKCAACGEMVEHAQSYVEAPLRTCDKCGGSIRRVIQKPTIIFNAPGFYVTDNRHEKRVLHETE